MRELNFNIVGKMMVTSFYISFQCPPCRSFTPELIYTYEKLKSDEKKFEVVFVSSDRSEDWYQQYAKTMPWPSVPYTDETRLQMLKTSFGVDGRKDHIEF